MILSLERVTYHYPGAATPALDDVSLDIQAGEFCLLAGLSGQGKSTLLRAACGLVPHFHGGRFAGRVTLAGLDTREHGPAQLGAFAGVLFGDPETQLVMSSVRAELALALESRGHGAAAVARGVEEVALALGIDGLLDRSTHELSGGEQQRVALGAALVGRPRVVLLDEPTSQLDPVAGDELIGLLRRLNQEWETTIVLAEHRLERCLGAADRVIALEHGRVAHDGEPGSFLEWAALRAPALQTPGARLFALAGLHPAPTGVKQARATLRSHGLLPREADPARAPAAPGEVGGTRTPRRGAKGAPARAVDARRVARAILRHRRAGRFRRLVAGDVGRVHVLHVDRQLGAQPRGAGGVPGAVDHLLPARRGRFVRIAGGAHSRRLCGAAHRGVRLLRRRRRGDQRDPRPHRAAGAARRPRRRRKALRSFASDPLPEGEGRALSLSGV